MLYLSCQGAPRADLVGCLYDPLVSQYSTGYKNCGEKTMQRQWVVSNPKVMMGKPVIAGTRITVELILEKLAAGETIEQIVEAHPHLTRDAILAALAFARDALRADVIYPLPETTA